MVITKRKSQRWVAILATVAALLAVTTPQTAEGQEPDEQVLVESLLIVPIGEATVPGVNLLGDNFKFCLNGQCVDGDVPGHYQPGMKQLVVRYWKESGSEVIADVKAILPGDETHCSPPEGQQIVGGFVASLSGTSSASYVQAQLGEWDDPSTLADEFELGEKIGVAEPLAEWTRGAATTPFCLSADLN